MSITQSAKKSLRQSSRRRTRNLLKKEAYKKSVKEYKSAAAAGRKEEAQALLSKVYKAIDKAAKTNVIHKDKAARLKSRLANLVR